jgi:iron complex outermembrane receptor protein
LQLYYDRTRRDIPASFAETLGTYDADFQHHLRSPGRNDIVWGLGYRASRDEVTNSVSLAFLPPEITRRWSSAFVQDEIPIAHDSIRFTVGTKFEHNDYTGFEVQPSARAAWVFSQMQMVWTAVSRAVRTPSRIDREFFAPANAPFLLAGGPDFESEDLVAYELGYRARPSDRAAFSVSTFFNDYGNVRSLEQQRPPAAFPLVLANGQTATAYGAELTADWRIRDWWRLQAGYTELQLHIRPKPGSTDSSFGGSEAHDPNHWGTVRQSFDLPRRLQADVGVRAVSHIFNYDVPAYVELDGRVGWRATPKFELAIVGQNLLHDHHAEFSAAASRKEPERGVYGKLTWRY